MAPIHPSAPAKTGLAQVQAHQSDPAPAGVQAHAPTKAQGPSAPADAVDAKPIASSAVLEGPTTTSAAALARIPESFPIHALSEIDARGLAGQTFLLDGGSLDGMKLVARRVNDGGEPGFELTFQLTSSKTGPMARALEKRGARRQPLVFRGANAGEDGVARLTGTKGEVTAGGSHAPADLERKHDEWVLALDGPAGGSIEAVHEKAAVAVRGFVRIRLRGDDAACTKQLQGLIKTTGIGHLLAPPTPAAKRKLLLMRALWQTDHAAAKKLAAEDFDKLRPEDVEKALLASGWDQARLKNLRFEEVCPGHFTAVDSKQAGEMVKAGARYLYSTVTKPEHVLSILTTGQKSSLQRYREGLIITGMSTNEDFSSGGACGVFTRMVTNGALYAQNDHSWAGRTYKLILSHELLGRTDWYGWDADYYGRRWGLDSKKNFGPDLVRAVDKGGNYRQSNELIFAAGNPAEAIRRVVATNAADRDKLIAHLAQANYSPPGGLTLEQFVVLSPKLMVFGPTPYDGLSDPSAFAKEAIEKAKNGDAGPLACFLTEGPTQDGVRAKVESGVLRSNRPELTKLALQAAKTNGRFSMDAAALDGVIAELEKRAAAKPDAEGKLPEGSHEAQEVLRGLTSQAGEAMFRSGSERAAALLASRTPRLDGDAWVRVLGDLDETSPVFELAWKECARDLLRKGHKSFLNYLEDHPAVSPADPKQWVSQQIADLGKPGTESFQLELYIAQAKRPEDIAWARALLIRSGSDEARRMLESSLRKERRLGIPGPTLAKLLEALPEKSSTRTFLFNTAPDLLLETLDPGVLALVKTHAAKANTPDLGIRGAEAWNRIADRALQRTKGETTPALREVLERGSSTLVHDDVFLAKLRGMSGLYAGKDPAALIEEALQEMGPGQGGHLKLAWILRGPEALAPARHEAAFQVLAHGGLPAKRILDGMRMSDSNGRLPFSASQIDDLVQRLHAGGHQEGLQHLLQTCAPQVLAGASPAILPLLGSTFSMASVTAREVIAELGRRTDAGAAEVKSFVIRQVFPEAVKSNDVEFFALLSAGGVTLDQLGRDRAWAAKTLLDAFGAKAYQYEKGADWPAKELAPGVTWLLRAGGQSLDAGVLAQVEKQIPSRKWKRPVIEGLCERIPGLSEDWRSRFIKGRKRNWLGL